MFNIELKKTKKSTNEVLFIDSHPFYFRSRNPQNNRCFYYCGNIKQGCNGTAVLLNGKLDGGNWEHACNFQERINGGQQVTHFNNNDEQQGFIQTSTPTKTKQNPVGQQVMYSGGHQMNPGGQQGTNLGGQHFMYRGELMNIDGQQDRNPGGQQGINRGGQQVINSGGQQLMNGGDLMNLDGQQEIKLGGQQDMNLGGHQYINSGGQQGINSGGQNFMYRGELMDNVGQQERNPGDDQRDMRESTGGQQVEYGGQEEANFLTSGYQTEIFVFMGDAKGVKKNTKQINISGKKVTSNNNL